MTTGRINLVSSVERARRGGFARGCDSSASETLFAPNRANAAPPFVRRENAAFSVELFKGLMLCFEIVVENERKVIANGPRSLSKACAIANASVGEGGLGPAHFQLLPYKSF